ncbi:MAG: urease accessory protein UreF, partial [Betaproteobacteria bacterium]|nr:urease accessory protein UreF [Betaproteobacteria bacterium]
MPTADAASRLAALLQLASPFLPVGNFSYSQGFEHAAHEGWVR